MVTSTQPRAGTQGAGAQPCSPDCAQHHELPPPRHQSSGPTESEDGRVETRSRESTVPRPAGPGFGLRSTAQQLAAAQGDGAIHLAVLWTVSTFMGYGGVPP
ncbi:unnamed protein product [Rangifer tarandus platyrhynchus]|uniref:Uncharacterized protein n=1 Tax=Rangifer tarandus platyrhynchus TaxID=3082113 RepID=A0AC59YWW9_RANTA